MSQRGPNFGRGSVCPGLLIGLLLGCEPAETPLGSLSEARLGVFYGGQIQERQELPRVLETAKQSQGFRLVFREPLAEDTRVRWQIEQPEVSKAAYVSRLGEVVVRAGQHKLDQAFHFEPSDPVGLWNIRVFVQDELVIDRAWLVYDPAARRRAKRSREP